MSHVPFKEEPKDTGPNLTHIAHIGVATAFPAYRSVIGWVGLFLLGMGIAMVIMSPMIVTENDNPRIREQDIRSETMAICKKLPGAFDPNNGIMSRCFRDPQFIEKGRKASYEKYPIPQSQPFNGIGLFLSLIGGGLLVCVWLPATLLAKAVDATEERAG